MVPMKAKGYVFPLVSGFYGIMRYRPDTYVEVYQTETQGVFSVCDELRKKGGEYDVADAGQIAWGKLTYKVQGTAVLI
jgi:hypothetical protein